MAVSYCLSGESIALRKLGFGEAPSDGEALFSRASRRTGRRDLKASFTRTARAWCRVGECGTKFHVVERHMLGGGGRRRPNSLP